MALAPALARAPAKWNVPAGAPNAHACGARVAQALDIAIALRVDGGDPGIRRLTHPAAPRSGYSLAVLTADEVARLVLEPESHRIERKRAFNRHGSNCVDKIREAICAFANDLPGTGQPGYVLVGVEDDGRLSREPITDETLRGLASLRYDGAILPIPSMEVYRVEVEPGAEVVVVEVKPAEAPPVRLRGRIVVRVGSTLHTATPMDERLLCEKQTHGARTYDQWPCYRARVSDLDEAFFYAEYLPKLLLGETSKNTGRLYVDLLASLRLYDLPQEVPTNGGILLIGKDPRMFIDGLWMQYVHFDGLSRTCRVLAHQEYQGTVFAQLAALERLPELTGPVKLPSGEEVPAYPREAIMELVVNAVLHRMYGMGNSPIQFYAYANRIEIDNPGGVHHEMRMEDFGRTTSYRNHLLAEALKAFGYVHKFGEGIPTVVRTLGENGNQPAEFDLSREHFGVVVRARQAMSAAFIEKETAVRGRMSRGERESLDAELAGVRKRVSAELAGGGAAGAELQDAVEAALLARLEKKAGELDERDQTKAAARRATAEWEARVREESLREGELKGQAAGLKEGKDAGLREGQAAALLSVLEARGISVSEEARARIQACTDLATLSRWTVAAVRATSIDEVFGG